MHQASIEISLVYKDNEKYRIEKVNAEKVGDYYQLKAIPAFANNLALNDIVSVEDDNGELFFNKLIVPSGHSVVHIVILDPEYSANIFTKLASFGIGINYLHNNLYLVLDIPVNFEYDQLKSFLNSEFNLSHIDYNEACISNQHRVNS